jgi:hypothetical protein
VPRTAENLIAASIALLPGGEQTYAQLAESGVIGKRRSARVGYDAARHLVGAVTNTFSGIWDSLSLDDLLDPIGAFPAHRRPFR